MAGAGAGAGAGQEAGPWGFGRGELGCSLSLPPGLLQTLPLVPIRTCQLGFGGERPLLHPDPGGYALP